MKRLLGVALLVLFAVGIEAQSSYRDEGLRGISIGGVWAAKNYSAQITDTSQVQSVNGARAMFLNISLLDSGSVYVYYRRSSVAGTFDAAILIDSLSNNVNGGASKAFALPADGLGAKQIEWVVVFQAFRLGHTSATFTAYQRRWY